MHHDLANQALYTGSEDGVLSGWSLASLPSRLQVGDTEIDDDMEDDNGDDPDSESEESEIESEDSEDGMDVDDDDEDRMEPGPRNGPIIGAGGGVDRTGRKKERSRPY